MELRTVLENTNIAETLDEELLEKIGEQVANAYEADEESRSDWLERSETWIKLATQVIETKSFPWPDASNVKYPILTLAAIQFHARAYPALIKEPNLLKLKRTGKTRQPEKMQRADRVSRYMSYQLLDEDDYWQEDADRLFLVLPLLGVCYKKTFFSSRRKKVISELVMPQDLVIDYFAKNFEDARKTHLIPLNKNQVIEQQRSGFFLDIDLEKESSVDQVEGARDEVQGLSPSYEDEDAPYMFLEQYTWYDLDDDGYKEPWIITIERDSRKVVRITPRFDVENVEINEEGLVTSITPTKYFTKFIFLPDPYSKTHGMGFGNLVGPLNEAVNTIINQLIDSGTINNLGGGFLAKGIRVRGGSLKFRPHEWKSVQTTGEDLRKGIFPLPIKEPSAVLFQLLGSLIEASKQMSSITDPLVGENPGQNQPYSTTASVMEQGLKVFVGIYKRIYRSLSQEFKKIYTLNYHYLEDGVYNNIIDVEEFTSVKQDFDLDSMDLIPSADPSLMSEALKLMKAESLLAKVAAGLPVNPQVATQMALEAEGHENIEELMTLPEPQPNFEQQIEMSKLELEKWRSQMEFQLKAVKDEYEAIKDQAQAMVNFAKAQATAKESDMAPLKAMMDQFNQEQDDEVAKAKIFVDAMKAKQQAQGTKKTDGGNS